MCPIATLRARNRYGSMSLLVFILVVIVLLALALWACESVPIAAPFNWIIRLVLILLAIVVIANRAGIA